MSKPNFDKEIDEIVAPLPEAKSNRLLIIAVTALGTMVVGLCAFMVGFFFLSERPAMERNSKLN